MSGCGELTGEPSNKTAEERSERVKGDSDKDDNILFVRVCFVTVFFAGRFVSCQHEATYKLSAKAAITPPPIPPHACN